MASEICVYVGKIEPWEFPFTYNVSIDIPDGGVAMGTYKVIFTEPEGKLEIDGIVFRLSNGVIKVTLPEKSTEQPQ